MLKKHLLVVSLTTILSTGLLAAGVGPLFAADTSPKAAEMPTKGTETAAKSTETTAKKPDPKEMAQKDLIKVSEDALMSMRNVHGARLAIFNGLPERAQTYVDAAATRIGATVKEADKYALDIKAPKADDRYVPFDASLTVLDTYKPSFERDKSIAKANEHLHKGEKKEAMEVLKLGAIDVAANTSLIPAKFAKEHIEEAAKLLSEGKYYEANLALKAVDDAVVVETYAMDAIPKPKVKS